MRPFLFAGRSPHTRRMKPVIESLLDTDLYKYTMWQAFLHAFPENQATYEFVCREQPDWLDVNRDGLEATVRMLPPREALTLPIEEQMIVEFYSR